MPFALTSHRIAGPSTLIFSLWAACSEQMYSLGKTTWGSANAMKMYYSTKISSRSWAIYTRHGMILIKPGSNFQGRLVRASEQCLYKPWACIKQCECDHLV